MMDYIQQHIDIIGRMDSEGIETLMREKACPVCDAPVPYTGRINRTVCKSADCIKIWNQMVSAPMREYYLQLKEAFKIYHDFKWFVSRHGDDGKYEWFYYLLNDKSVVYESSWRTKLFKPPDTLPLKEKLMQLKLIKSIKTRMESLSKIDYTRELMIAEGISPCYPCTFRINKHQTTITK